MAVDEDLETAIDAAPDDPYAYRVYGDWLEAKGDPRGELVAVQTRQLGARGKELAQLKAREAELFATYPDELFGKALAADSQRHAKIDWYCGFIRAVDAGFSAPILDSPATRFVREARGLLPRARAPLAAWWMWSTQPPFEWLRGCNTLEALGVDGQCAALPRDILDGLRMLHVNMLAQGDAFDRLTKQPLPRLDVLGFRSVRAPSLPLVVDAVHALSPRQLRLELTALAGATSFERVSEIASAVTSLGLDWFDRAETLGALSRVTFESARTLTIHSSGVRPDGSAFEHLPALPRLHRLVLGPSATDELPNMARFATSSLPAVLTDLDAAVKDVFSMRALCAEPFPRLERLVLRAAWFSGTQMLWSPTAFGSDAKFPALRSIEIDARKHVAHIAASPLSARIEDLTVPVDDDSDAREILDARPRFPRLQSIAISGDRQLSPAMLEELCMLDVEVRWKRLAPAVQETPPWLQA